MRLTFALFLAGLLGCLTHCLGPARAETAKRPATATLGALRALCGPGHEYLAPYVDEAATDAGLPVVYLVALMYAENHRCDPRRVNRRTGAVGLTQILPHGNANPRRLTTEQLKDPATNLRLGARHLRRMMRLCGNLGGAVSLYHGNGKAYRRRGKCDVDSHARKVMALVARAWREMRRQNEPAS